MQFVDSARRSRSQKEPCVPERGSLKNSKGSILVPLQSCLFPISRERDAMPWDGTPAATS